MNFINLSISFVALANICFCQESPQITLDDGILEGVHRTSRNGLQYSAFLGIPYAKSPTRFRLAEPSGSWEGIKEVKQFGDLCVQLAGDSVTGSEDCLFLNVFTPAEAGGSLPVMFYIHGGAFKSGGANEYGERFLMDEGVVYVSINYRLGALGFLDTEDGQAEGNLALKDSLLALQWVRDNIHAFGGDPSQVTIFGTSAGSMLAHHHLLSPLTEGLFTRAILMSGASLLFSALIENPLKAAIALGNLLNCGTGNSTELVNCLSDKSAEDIVMNQVFTEWYIDPIVTFGVTVDSPHSQQIFVRDKPINVLTSGEFNKVPTMFTVMEDEGILLHTAIISRTEALYKQLNDDYLRIFPISLDYKNRGFTEEQKNAISQNIREFYFGDKEIGPGTFQEMTNMYSDRGFVTGVEKAISLQAKHHAVFAGVFTYKGAQSTTQQLGIEEPLGVTHGDDAIYLFDHELFPIPEGHKDEEMSKYFVKIYTNFAKFGDPRLTWGVNGTWSAVDPVELENSGKITWAKIDSPPSLVDNPFKERFEFWETVFDPTTPSSETPTPDVTTPNSSNSQYFGKFWTITMIILLFALLGLGELD